MAKKDIIVVGASAGGVEALRRLAAGLTPNFAGTIFVVWHMAAESPRVLAGVISKAGPLPAVFPKNDDTFTSGKIYVGPPDHHFLIDKNRIRLTRGPKENRFRPAIDPLFRSAARAYGSRVVGVILTGGLDDGTAGLQIVKRLGGTAIVQDPNEAYAPSMPTSAMTHVAVDYCLRIDQIAPKLNELTKSPAGSEEVTVPEDVDIEVRIALAERAMVAGVAKLGEPSCFTCPECHGVLLKLKKTDPERFRCHTGHAYTLDTLLSDLAEKSDDSIWNAVRSLEEESMLVSHLVNHWDNHKGRDREALLKRVAEIESRAEIIRQTTINREPS